MTLKAVSKTALAKLALLAARRGQKAGQSNASPTPGSGAAAMTLEEIATVVGRDWVAGPYYDQAEAVMGVQWNTIFPLIRGYNFTKTLDLGAGHGRNTSKLLEFGGSVTAVDINQSNIEYLNERFGGNVKVRIVKNNGVDLRDIPDSSITFIYSFDAMVHFDSDVVRSYIKEFRRIIEPEGIGFCHYSNVSSDPTGNYQTHLRWRNYMSRGLFEHWLLKEGFTVIESYLLKANQVIVEEDDGDTDAITIFGLPSGTLKGPAFGHDKG
jgi:ubiquinone/menaquinone biosynthesis C-methylase UbiE